MDSLAPPFFSSGCCRVRRAGAEEENVAPGFHRKDFHPMQRTRAGLYHNSFSGRKATNRKDTVRLDPKILRKSPVLRHAVGPKIQAHEKVTPCAIKAFAARFVAIPNDPLTFLEVLHG